jgi:hypothetical protein
MLLAPMCGGLALATWGCALGALVFKGDYQQTMRDAEVCDGLSSEVPSEVPFLVELRTDKAGATRDRDLRLGGTEVDPQWVPIPDQHAAAAGWIQAGNFTKMDFQPPLQRELTPGSVTYVAYAPEEARDAREQAQLNALNFAFGPEFGSFRWSGRMYVTPQCTSCCAFRPRSREPRNRARSRVD